MQNAAKLWEDGDKSSVIRKLLDFASQNQIPVSFEDKAKFDAFLGQHGVKESTREDLWNEYSEFLGGNREDAAAAGVAAASTKMEEQQEESSSNQNASNHCLSSSSSTNIQSAAGEDKDHGGHKKLKDAPIDCAPVPPQAGSSDSSGSSLVVTPSDGAAARKRASSSSPSSSSSSSESALVLALASAAAAADNPSKRPRHEDPPAPQGVGQGQGFQETVKDDETAGAAAPAAAADSVASPLPAGWTEHFDPATKKTFYHHAGTRPPPPFSFFFSPSICYHSAADSGMGKTQWEKPSIASAASGAYCFIFTVVVVGWPRRPPFVGRFERFSIFLTAFAFLPSSTIHDRGLRGHMCRLASYLCFWWCARFILLPF